MCVGGCDRMMEVKEERDMIKLISLGVDEDRFSNVEVLEFSDLEMFVEWVWFGCVFDNYMGKLLCVNGREGMGVDELVKKLEECYEKGEVEDWDKNKRKFKKLVGENDGWRIWSEWGVEYDSNVSVIVCDEWEEKKMLDGKKMSKVCELVGEMRNKKWEVLYGGGG